MQSKLLANYSSSGEESSSPRAESPVKYLLPKPMPSPQEILVHNMPYQDLSELSAISNASAPVKRSIDVLGDAGYVIRNAEDLHLLVTKTNMTDCFDALKNHLKGNGPFAMTTNPRTFDMETEYMPLKATLMHLTMRDLKKTLGPNADLEDLARCSMYRVIYLTPSFSHVKGHQETQRTNMVCETSTTCASVVLENADK